MVDLFVKYSVIIVCVIVIVMIISVINIIKNKNKKINNRFMTLFIISASLTFIIGLVNVVRNVIEYVPNFNHPMVIGVGVIFLLWFISLVIMIATKIKDTINKK